MDALSPSVYKSLANEIIQNAGWSNNHLYLNA